MKVEAAKRIGLLVLIYLVIWSALLSFWVLLGHTFWSSQIISLRFLGVLAGPFLIAAFFFIVFSGLLMPWAVTTMVIALLVSVVNILVYVRVVGRLMKQPNMKLYLGEGTASRIVTFCKDEGDSPLNQSKARFRAGENGKAEDRRKDYRLRAKRGGQVSAFRIINKTRGEI